jgi:hypothetical protein
MVGLTSGMRKGVKVIMAADTVVDMVEGTVVAMVDMYLDAVGMAAGIVTLALVVDTVVVRVAGAVDMEVVVGMAVDTVVVGAVTVEVVAGTRTYKCA